MAKHSIDNAEIINDVKCSHVIALRRSKIRIEISKYRKNSLSKLSAWSFLNRLEVEQAACIKSRIS